MRTSRLAWILCAAALALVATSVVLALLNDLRSSTDFGTRAYPLLAAFPGMAFPIVGALIASRGSRNAIGWILLAMGVGIGASEAASQYALYALVTDPSALPYGRTAAWLGGFSFPYTSCVFVILLFPDGRLPSPRWRPAAGVIGAGIVTVNVASALSPGRLPPFPVDNPLGIDGARSLLAVLDTVGTVLLGVGAIAAAASVAVRFRRGHGVERLQVQWFLLAAAALALLVPLEPVSPVAEDAVVIAFGAGLPAAVGIAVLRYRLYDIDLVIRRTLTYGALTGTLSAAYLLVVLIAQAVLPNGSALTIAISTLAVAALFRPALSRIQTAIDRRFFRRRYDTEQTLASFGAQVRDEVDLDRLGEALTGAVGEAMQPAHVSLWLR